MNTNPVGKEAISVGDLLAKVIYPEDLRQLPEGKLFEFSQELRNYIIEHCSIHGGHFAASLGVVELTTALHYVFNTPEDLVVWDVGHQAYGHKIITGRREKFHTNRLYQGISGFPKRSESIYDAFGVGHSSTSISAVLGMAVAAQYAGNHTRQHIAVIGDGAMTAGLAFEALNHAGVENSNILVILNDNCMSIDPNVGALKDYLTDITTSRTYNYIRDEAWKLLGKIDRLSSKARFVASKLEDLLTANLSKPGMLFEALKFRYFGPIDGHDVTHLAHVLQDLKKIQGPKLLHCVTVKGKGFAPAEADQTKWHAPSFNFDKITGKSFSVPTNIPSPPKFQDVFGYTIVELAEQNDKIMGITPAMPSGCSLNLMMEKMPQRTFDVGIAEQHAVTFSAGLATQGLVPFCNIYSSFMQRAYDQVIHDVAIQELPVVFCLDRGGLVGADGATHHGAYDLAYMRCIPNIVVSAPRNEQQLRNLMYTASLSKTKGPFTIRYPRGEGTMIGWKTPFQEITIGTGEKICDGQNIAILTIGTMAEEAITARKNLMKQGITPAIYDLRFIKPLDEALLHEVASNYQFVITVEDGCLMGGAGSAILEWFSEHNYFLPIKRLGVPDRVVEHGTQPQLYAECGYGYEAIQKTVLNYLKVNLVC